MDCAHWPDSRREYYEKANEGIDFFKSDTLTMQEKTVAEFPIVKKKSKDLGRVKVGRNAPCPCGSGEKYKNCCIGC
jgi:uncharacterized protein YecA (UPF0149 family)